MLCKDCWNFLAGQALALSGDNRDEDSNFMQILKLRAKGIPQLAYWMKRKQNKFVSHDIQNEIIQTMENQMEQLLFNNTWRVQRHIQKRTVIVLHTWVDKFLVTHK